MTAACLPFPGAALCGYCDRPLTLQPAGDWACDPCRALMAEVIVGPPPGTPPWRAYDVLADQWREMQRRARAAR